MNELETFTKWRPSVSPPTDEQREATHVMLIQAIEQEERQLRHAPAPHRPRQRAAIASVATVAVVLAVLVGVIGLGPTTAPLGSGPAAAAALNEAAESADMTLTTLPPGPILDTNKYVHTTSKGVYLHAEELDGTLFAALVPFRREVWIAADGSGRLIRTDGEPEFLTEQDQAIWEAAGRPIVGGTDDQIFGPGGFSTEALAALPTEPDQLRRHLIDELAGSSKPIEAALFDRIRQLLSESDLAPELRISLYRVAATIDGIELLDNIADREGRPGAAVGLTYTHSGIERRSVMIFDPSTAELLGTESIILSESPEIRAPLPFTIGYVTYGTSEVVDHIPDK